MGGGRREEAGGPKMKGGREYGEWRVESRAGGW